MPELREYFWMPVRSARCAACGQVDVLTGGEVNAEELVANGALVCGNCGGQLLWELGACSQPLPVSMLRRARSQDHA